MVVANVLIRLRSPGRLPPSSWHGDTPSDMNIVHRYLFNQVGFTENILQCAERVLLSCDRLVGGHSCIYCVAGMQETYFTRWTEDVIISIFFSMKQIQKGGQIHNRPE